MADPITALTPAPTITVLAPTPIAAGIHTQPQFDPLELLPSAAQERLRRLRIRRDDAFAVTISHAELQALTVERLQADQRLRQLRAHPHDHGYKLPETDARVVAQQKLVDKLTADLQRLNERSEARAAAFQTASAPLAACEDWLKHGKPSGVVLQDLNEPAPKLNKNEDVLSGIERLRRRVRELRADLHRIASAPMPSSYAKQKMREQVGQLAARGAPSASLLVEHDGEIVWATMQLRSEVYNAQAGAIAFAEVPDVVALAAWLHKDALIAALDREIAAEADDAASLSHEERQRQEAQVLADLLAVEFQEASLVWRGQSEGLSSCEHRADCSPQAVLQVQLVTAPRAIDGPTTSPLAFDIVQPYGGRR